MLVASEDLAEVQRLLHEWGEPSSPGGNFSPVPLAPESQWLRLTLGADSTRVPRLVVDLRAQERTGEAKPPYRVSPNHVLRGNSHGGLGGTASQPEPATDPFGSPPPGTGASVERPVRVAIVDTGELIKHPWLDGRVERLDSAGVRTTNPDDERDHPNPLPRYTGHATFVAGVVLQHAPHATVVQIKGLDGWGEVPDTAVADIIRALPSDIDVLHLSCAGPTHDNLGLPATQEALAQLWARNPKIQVIAPAGNAGLADIPWFPGALRGVIAVTALSAEGTRPSFSNSGAWVDACAPGVRVKSTFLHYTGSLGATHAPHGSTTEWGEPGEDRTFDGWAYWDGTSFAAARITGAIAEVARPGVDGALAAFEVVGGGQRRLDDNGFDLGVPVFAASWT